jgi:outer membrane protein OmpA-like peptidoglycan-associated protein
MVGENGIAASRLTAKGYGESQLVNDCMWTYEQIKLYRGNTQANRRSEFIIVSMHKSSKQNKGYP